MQSAKRKLLKLEEQASRNGPIFLITFTDGSTQRMNLLMLLCLRIDIEAGISTQKIQGCQRLRGKIGGTPFLKRILRGE